MHLDRNVTLLVLFAGFAVAGCDAPTQPLELSDVARTYVLASIDGARVPVPFGEGSTIVADTIWLRPDMTARTRSVGGDAAGRPSGIDGTWSGRWSLDPARRVIGIHWEFRGSTTRPYAVLRGGAELWTEAADGALWRWVRTD